MARRLDWDKAGREERVRQRGAARAAPEAKDVNYPRPLEPSKDALRKSRGKQASRPEEVDVEGKRYKVVSLDGRPSARQKALKQSREAGDLQDPGWAKPKKRGRVKPKKKRRR